MVAKIARFESGFNADAQPRRRDGTLISSAHGYGQFIDGTWTDVLNQHGAKYGIAGAGKLTQAQASRLAAILPSPLKWQVIKPGKYVAKRSKKIGKASGAVRRDGLADCLS